MIRLADLGIEDTQRYGVSLVQLAGEIPTASGDSMACPFISRIS